MNKIIIILIISLNCLTLQSQRSKPTSKGITQYIESYQDTLINEYESKIDTLYEVLIYTENLDRWDGELGDFYIPNEVVITNKEKFVAYEFKYLSRFKQLSLSPNDRTVKGVVFHELTHAYFYKKVITLTKEHRNVNHYYSYGTLYYLSDPEAKFGVKFIEEGICEYVMYYINEAPFIKEYSIPKTKEELIDLTMEINNIYYYSPNYLKNFLDKYGISKSIEILITNKPPSYFEILVPRAFFTRLTLENKN
jgi:hypothetical protein